MGIWTNLNRLIDSKRTWVLSPDEVKVTWAALQVLLLVRMKSGVLVKSMSSFSWGGRVGGGRSKRRTWAKKLSVRWSSLKLLCSSSRSDWTSEDARDAMNFECVATIHYNFCCFLNHYEATYTATEHLNHLVICQAPNHFNLKGVDNRR